MLMYFFERVYWGLIAYWESKYNAGKTIKI